MSKGPAQPNRSLAHGVACLQAIAMAPHPLGSREVARELRMEHTRVNRMLGTLAQLGLAEKNAERKYQPGPAIHVLAAQSLKGSRLLLKALPHLRNLMDTGLTVALGVLWNRHVCYLFYCPHGIPIELGIGACDPYPAAKSSIGQVLLAGLPDAQVRRFLGGRAEDLPAGGLAAFLSTLRVIRNKGYALVHNDPESATLGVPLGMPPLAGVALAGRIQDQDLPRLISRLKQATDAIDRSLAP